MTARILALFFCAVMIFAAAPAQAAKNTVLDITAFKTSAGIPVWLVTDATAPVISMSFSFKGGLAYDPPGKPGVGRLVSILLDEGAGDMKSQAFQAQLADHAIDLSFSAGRDAFHGQLRTVREHRALAFDLLRLSLTAPRFDADAIERMKNANTAQLRRDMGDPSWLSARTFNGMIFEGHTYALPGFGTLESMKTITRRDLQDFAAAQFARGALSVAIAGDINRDEAEKMVDAVFGTLPETPRTVEGTPADFRYAGKTILLPLDTPQTYISAGHAGIPRQDPDWHAALVANYILGGSGFDARLMREIREKRGLTYGVYSRLQNMDHAALIQATLSTGNEKTAEALRLLREEWQSMHDKGPTEKELADAKAYLTGSLLLELTSTESIADIMNALMRDGEAPDYINRRNAMIDAVTLQDARRAARKMLKPDALTVILVGNPVETATDITLKAPPGIGKEGTP